MILDDYESIWRNYLSGEQCPPVLGLAPLSEEESKSIRRLIRIQYAQRGGYWWQTLFRLINKYPASLAVWVARKAGEAYESGAFWDKFEAAIGAEIPLNQREVFAKRFRQACRDVMSEWVPPTELGSQRFVAEFLYQAGLPLDRCAGFAQHVRKVEQKYGLPDPISPDAGEILCEAVLESLESTAVPTLKRALRGPAGMRICEVALDVVLNGNFSGINPRLGEELEKVFSDTTAGTLRRAARQPFLRLGANFESLEIVGPKQEQSIVSSSRVTWIVDGKHNPTLRTEEFVHFVTGQARIVVELAGILPPRTFVLRLDDLAEPYLLFDEYSRRQRRMSDTIPPGNYMLLHRAEDALEHAEERIDWQDGKHALSFFKVSPGREAHLKGEHLKPVSFKAALKPFLEPEDKRLLHDGNDPIYYAWSEMPCLWLPEEETTSDRIDLWYVCLKTITCEYKWPITRSPEKTSGMVKCYIECNDFLSTQKSGLYRFDLTLRRGERSRVEARQVYWYWHGLERYDAHRFYLSAMPENLIRDSSCGFEYEQGLILHKEKDDINHWHTLCFNIEGEQVTFSWPQPGISLEWLERVTGKQATPKPCKLGSVFSASMGSTRWLRIWKVGIYDCRLLVEGQEWERAENLNKKQFTEISLASLAPSFPGGGEITLTHRDYKCLIARFTSPLHATVISRQATPMHTVYRFDFPQPIEWVRPIFREISSGESFESVTGQELTDGSVCVFEDPGCPKVVISHTLTEGTDIDDSVFPVIMQVQQTDCPEGFWLCELQSRRDNNSSWETVTQSGLKCAPLVFERKVQVPISARARLFWKVLRSSPEETDVQYDTEGRDNLCDLLSDLIDIINRRYIEESWAKLSCLKGMVRSLSILAGLKLRRSHGSPLQQKMLNFACQDPDHTGFVHLPGLLALPTSEYRELPQGDPLNDALRICV